MRNHLNKFNVPFLFALLGCCVVNAAEEPQTLIFFGDSLTAGYGIDPDSAYPALLQTKFRAVGMNHQVVNAGLSGETTAGGLRRVNWILRREPDIFVLALGGNDGMRGIDTEVTQRNLQGIIDRVKERFPSTKIILAGMEAPPNMGDEFTARFRSIFPALAKKNDLLLIPFLLEGVGGVRELNLPDGVHPTEEGHKVMAEHLWKTLYPLLNESSDTANNQAVSR